MISKNKIKYIRSLELKKNRNKEGKFVAEGFKVVDDLLALQPADLIVATEECSQYSDRQLQEITLLIPAN